MSHRALTEEPLQFGERGRLFGILTLPDVPARSARALPTFLFLNAGLLHRVGPFRLYVHLARHLAHMGFAALRVDLAGRGDSPERPGLTTQQSVAADYAEITAMLESRFGRVPLVVAGLCSGADDAVRLALADERIVGMVLLDPICFRDDGFHRRAALAKYTSPLRYVRWLKRRVRGLAAAPAKQGAGGEPMDPLSIRDLPNREQVRDAFEAIGVRAGRVLSVFTEYATRYYNRAGQMGRVLDVADYRKFCTERFWPEAEHTYVLDVHRRRLVDEVGRWAAEYLR